MQKVRGEVSAPEPWVSIYPCDDCKHPELAQQERDRWTESDRCVMELAARGLLLDAQGNQIEPIIVIQRGGEYETHRYFIDPQTDTLAEKL
jgi:hypothetical protein